MGTGSWIARGFRLYLSHWRRLAAGAVVLLLLYFALIALALGGGTAHITPFVLDNLAEVGWDSLKDSPGWLIAILAVLDFTVVAMFYLGYSFYVLKLVRNEKSTFLDILFPFKMSLRVIGVTVLYRLVVFLGLIPGLPVIFIFGIGRSSTAGIVAGSILSAPGFFYMMTSFFFGSIALVDRDLGPIRALSESWHITGGRRFSIFLMILLFQILGGLLKALSGIFFLKPVSAVAFYGALYHLFLLPWSYAAYMSAYEDRLVEAHPAEEPPPPLPT